jgi:hypothetical protein
MIVNSQYQPDPSIFSELVEVLYQLLMGARKEGPNSSEAASTGATLSTCFLVPNE